MNLFISCRSNLKKDPAPAADKAVNGITVDVEKTSLTVKEPETPVQIEVGNRRRKTCANPYFGNGDRS